ncbi:expressed protein [Phakopsora pachyrhizi]|uniref:Expressed protein n=1 Tax=Phakopsora pachyrhizi TaxID=170000 RepID=A0AAV0B8E5_PHAPC|nr:expressed protein [Phakopsora pachyrhizi]
MSNIEAETVLKLRSERESIEASNKRLLDPLEDSVVSGNDQSSPKRQRTESSNTPETTPMQTQLVSQTEAEREPLRGFKIQNLNFFEQSENLKHSKSLLSDPYTVFNKAFIEDLVFHRKKLTPASGISIKRSNEKQNNDQMNLFTGKETKGKEKVISEEKGTPLNFKLNSMGQNTMITAQKSFRIELNGKPSAKITVKPKLLSIESIKTLLSDDIDKSGPFDLEGKREFSSPYNRDLLSMIEKNLRNLIPKELDEFEFQDNFLDNIKNTLWKDEKGFFLTTNESVLDILFMEVTDSKVRDKKCSWIKFSAKGLKTHKNRFAHKHFSFKAVFNKFIKYENLSRFFFTDNIRLKSISFFEDLDLRLSRLLKGYAQRRRSSLDSILTQTWNALTGFLAYVHAINAIIVPSGSLKPLSHEQLIAKQEEAFKFFCGLHADIEKFCVKQRTRKTARAYSTINAENMSFEQIRDCSINQLLNSRFSRNHVAWIYIELWMFKYRPELQEINYGFTYQQQLIKRSKLKSFLNRTCFILFSGMARYEMPENETSRVKDM